MPIIILEGVDGAGKSTLAEEIAAQSKWPTTILHRGVPEKGVIEEYVLPLLEWPDDQLLICDRWHLGEIIYGPIYRGHSMVAGKWERVIEYLLTSLNAVCLVVTADLDTIKNRLETRGEDYLQPEHVELVWSQYRDYATSHRWVEIEVDSPARTAATILEVVNNVAYR